MDFLFTFDRTGFNKFWAYIGTAIGLASLALGLFFTDLTLGFATHEALMYVVIGFWILAPPIFFWWDWMLVPASATAETISAVQHTHDLARNIWLALVIVLIIATKKVLPFVN